MNYLLTLYVVTIAVSVSLAVFLANLARSTSQARIDLEKKKKKGGYQSSDIIDDEELKKSIYDSVHSVVGSKKKSQKVSSIVSDIVSNEVGKKIEENAKELDKKYGQIIEEKTQSEEVVWKRYNKVLTEKKDTEAVIRSIAEGLVVVDAEGNVIMMNPAAESLLGVSKKDKIGKPVAEDMKNEQLVSLMRSGSENKKREIEIISKEDETKRIVRSSSAIIENENGQTVGMVSVLSDITKQRELEDLKTKFVANVTHELRTPLTIVKNSINMLIEENIANLTKNQKEFMELAKRNISRLGILIDDLLDLSKIEAGKMEFKRELMDIGPVMEDAVNNFIVWADKKSIKLEKFVQKSIPKVNIDVGRINQVLTNLISNSVKFTPNNGKIDVEAVYRKESNEVEVSVRDSGIGINKEDLPKVFDRFYQIGERTSGDINGTGVGLSIAKEMVEMHGGRIWAESKKGQGTKFIFTLPGG
ncbi:MAG: ATP-binding protein [Candidatus Omnitrophota bacterium]